MSPSWTQVGGYCDGVGKWEEFANMSDTHRGQHWSETHCVEDVGHFTDGVQLLREQLEPAGCKVVSTLLLRDPVDQITSEWVYFHNEESKRGTSTPVEWAALAPENELSWFIGDSEFWEKRERQKPIASCDSAMGYIKQQMDRIDLVGTVDSPEQFAQWWLALGDMAGFDVNSDNSPAVRNNRPGTESSDVAAAAEIDQKQREEIRRLNPCSYRARDEAARRMAQTVSSKRTVSSPAIGQKERVSDGSTDFDRRVEELVRRWGGVIPILDAPDESEVLRNATWQAVMPQRRD
jgi:hypothetical protein